MSDQPTPTIQTEPLPRETFSARSPAHAKFAEAGGYDLLRRLHEIANDQDLPYAVLVQLADENIGSGRVPDHSGAEVQACAMAGQGRLEDLLSALAAHLCVPLGPEGDGDLDTSESREIDLTGGR